MDNPDTFYEDIPADNPRPAATRQPAGQPANPELDYLAPVNTARQNMKLPALPGAGDYDPEVVYEEAAVPSTNYDNRNRKTTPLKDNTPKTRGGNPAPEEAQYEEAAVPGGDQYHDYRKLNIKSTAQNNNPPKGNNEPVEYEEVGRTPVPVVYTGNGSNRPTALNTSQRQKTEVRSLSRRIKDKIIDFVYEDEDKDHVICCECCNCNPKRAFIIIMSIMLFVLAMSIGAIVLWVYGYRLSDYIYSH